MIHWIQIFNFTSTVNRFY